MKYVIKLSNSATIKIDEDELPNVLTGITSGRPVKVRQGIFNPSFFVAVVEDVERSPINHYTDGIKERPNLPDIFEKTPRLQR